ncbi:21309_t:CDS:2, partial [Entrophospora sp. SA101]
IEQDPLTSSPDAYYSKHLSLDLSYGYALLNFRENADKWIDKVENADSIFIGAYSPGSCDDYTSGTNHTLPTYGYAK